MNIGVRVKFTGLPAALALYSDPKCLDPKCFMLLWLAKLRKEE
ncbi:MAG: hypothetical protein ACJAVI_005649 [Candidatus Azotimanducaceae bacterium]|jgi:hypothetical protein